MLNNSLEQTFIGADIGCASNSFEDTVILGRILRGWVRAKEKRRGRHLFDAFERTL